MTPAGSDRRVWWGLVLVGRARVPVASQPVVMLGVAGLVVAVLAIAVQPSALAGDTGRLIQLWTFKAVIGPLMAVVAVLSWRAAGPAGQPPRVRRTWRMLAVAFACVTFGDLYGFATAVALGPTVRLSGLSPVDVANVVAVLLCVTAILLIPVRSQGAGGRLRLGLDLGTVLLSAGVFLFYFTVAPSLDAGGDTVGVGVRLAQTAGVLVVVFAIARVTVAGAVGVPSSALRLLALAGVVEAAQEAVGPVLQDTSWSFVSHAAQILFRALLIGAALAQWRFANSHDAAAATRRVRPFSILPYAAVAATDALLVVALAHSVDGRAWAVVVGGITLTGLVVTRQVIAFRENVALLGRLDRSVTALRQAVGREQALAELGTKLMTARDAGTIRDLGARAALALLADQTSVRAAISVPAAGGGVEIVAAAGEDADAVVGTRIRTDVMPPGVVDKLQRGLTVAVDHLSEVGVESPDGPDYGRRAVVFLPLHAGERRFGVMTVTSGSALPADVRKSLETLRMQLALALESAALTAELTALALHDPLTGLANRAQLHDRLDGAADRCLTALVIDLDGFKQVNDEYGHEAGDAILVAVAQRLRECIRPTDLAVRLGGDEFAILMEDLPGTRRAGELADRVAEAIEQPVAFGVSTLRVGASIGVATTGAEVTSLDDLLRVADAAMYEVKRRRTGGTRREAAAVPGTR